MYTSEDHSNRTRIETPFPNAWNARRDIASEDHSNRTRIETAIVKPHGLCGILPQKTIPIEQGLKPSSVFVSAGQSAPQKTIPIEQGLKHALAEIRGRVKCSSEDHSNRTRIETFVEKAVHSRRPFQ